MLLRFYAAVAGLLTVSYVGWPMEQRSIPFLLVTLGTVPGVLVALRRTAKQGRRPWWLMLGSLMSYNVGNLTWIWVYEASGRTTGDGSVAELFLTAGGILSLCAGITLVMQGGRRDMGGVIDSVITAVALGGVLWDAVLLPELSAGHVPAGRQVALFVNVLVMVGTLGAMLRVSLVSARWHTSLRFFTVGIALTLAGNVAAALTVDPVTGLRPDWTNALFLGAYVAAGCAALHPSAASATRPGRAPEDDLTGGRLTFLGVMLALSPLIGGGRAALGLPVDGILIAFSSAALIPLVMVRIARLSRARRAAERALHRLATSDGLTGLPNRAACLDRLGAELATEPGSLAVFFCDLDGFKPVNDRLGHAAGDELLVAVAGRLRSCVRDGDLVSRFGGDEFVIVCRGGGVQAVCDRIRAVVSEPIGAGGEQVRVGLSVGVAFARPGDTTDDVIGRADLAMYRAKQSKSVGTLSLVMA
ncbi:GGDEF domain-containing protein [Nucisporomicrobium flavum]|uniref:GGDEF domain-containing protein n=1 Tax=Nucisporomicrobium flavum TaxID=2785915 RepID=UPI0018F688D6|nr:GGDEF domain-containing protein [Nucisporomicrobium flavum]